MPFLCTGVISDIFPLGWKDSSSKSNLNIITWVGAFSGQNLRSCSTVISSKPELLVLGKDFTTSIIGDQDESKIKTGFFIVDLQCQGRESRGDHFNSVQNEFMYHASWCLCFAWCAADCLLHLPYACFQVLTYWSFGVVQTSHEICTLWSTLGRRASVSGLLIVTSLE